MTGCTAGQQVNRSTGHLVHGLWLRLGRVLGSRLLVSYYWGSRWLLRPLMFAAGSGLVVGLDLLAGCLLVVPRLLVS